MFVVVAVMTFVLPIIHKPGGQQGRFERSSRLCDSFHERERVLADSKGKDLSIALI